jgi:hypothetical protein
MTARRTTSADASQLAAPETVHAPLLLYFPEVVKQCGGCPESLFREAGIGPDDTLLGRTTYRQIAALLELAASSLGRPDFGMLLAFRQCRDGIEGPLGHVMRHARSFEEVLELAVHHSYAHSLASQTWLRRSPSGSSVLFGHDIVLEGLGATGQVMEQILLVGHLTAIRLTGGAVRARRILLRHRRLSPASVYRRYFGCEVRFDEPVNATQSIGKRTWLTQSCQPIPWRFARSWMPSSSGFYKGSCRSGALCAARFCACWTMAPAPANGSPGGWAFTPAHCTGICAARAPVSA